MTLTMIRTSLPTYFLILAALILGATFSIETRLITGTMADSGVKFFAFLGPTLSRIDAYPSRERREDASREMGTYCAQPTNNQGPTRIDLACFYRVFADGGSNRVYDILGEDWKDYQPNLIIGDLDSIRPTVHKEYRNQGVRVIRDGDMNATDLMKAVNSIKVLEETSSGEEYSLIILGGLTGRLDQTVHTMSYLYKLRNKRRHVFVVTDDNIGWVLDSGEHHIALDRTFLGPTCGLLPVGVCSTTLSMKGLEWDWTDHESSFDGDISTSNWLASDNIWIKTTAPIWWTIELRLHEKHQK